MDFEEDGSGWVSHPHSYALYTEACTVVKTDAGLNESFDVKVGLH